MSGSADTPPPSGPGSPGGPDPVFQLSGEVDGNDGRWARGVVLINPATRAPYAADSGTTGSSVALNDTLHPSRGAVVTADGALVVDPSAVTAPTSVADGADVVLGTSADSAGANSVLGQLKQLAQDLAGTLAVDASSTTVPVSASAPLPTTTPKGTTAFSQVTVGTVPTLVLAANPARISAVLQNVTGGSALVLGNDANVVAAAPGDGQYLGLVVAAGGDAEDTDSTSAWFGVCASGSADVRVVEVR